MKWDKDTDSYSCNDSFTSTSNLEGLANVVSKAMFDVQDVTLQGLKFREQVKLLAETKIVVSMHGNGLTHSLWLSPERSGEELLVEIFPSGVFTLDYQVSLNFPSIFISFFLN